MHWPHIHYGRGRALWGCDDDLMFRVCGFKPHCRLTLFDFTRHNKQVRLRIGPWLLVDTWTSDKPVRYR